MTVELDHTIVQAHDKHESARFIAEILDLAPPITMGPFAAVVIGHGVNLDFADSDEVVPHHYAFRVSDEEFDAIFERIVARSLDYWADPRRDRKMEIRHHGASRGFYFEDPSGHFLEVLTRPDEPLAAAS